MGAKPSATLNYEVLEDGGVRLTAKSSTFTDHLDAFPKKSPKSKITIEMMNKAVETEAAKHHRRSKA